MFCSRRAQGFLKSMQSLSLVRPKHTSDLQAFWPLSRSSSAIIKSCSSKKKKKKRRSSPSSQPIAIFKLSDSCEIIFSYYQKQWIDQNRLRPPYLLPQSIFSNRQLPPFLFSIFIIFDVGKVIGYKRDTHTWPHFCLANRTRLAVTIVEGRLRL